MRRYPPSKGAQGAITKKYLQINSKDDIQDT